MSLIKQLEKLFAAEVEGRLPFQTKAKWIYKLSDEGYVQAMTTRLGGQFPLRIDGWQLTHLGRLTYCESCNKPLPQSDSSK